MQMEILQSGLERRPGRAILYFSSPPMFVDIKKTLRATSGKQRSNMDATEYASDLGRRSAAA